MTTRFIGDNATIPGTAQVGILQLTGGAPAAGQRPVSDESGILTLGYSVVTPTAVDYAALLSDDLILVTVTGKTVTLPDAATCAGKAFTVKVTISGSATVATTSAQTIDGASTYALAAQYNSVTLVSDGSNWNIIAKV